MVTNEQNNRQTSNRHIAWEYSYSSLFVDDDNNNNKIK